MAASPLLICTATELESAILRERLANDTAVRIVHTGVGVVNAAHAVTLSIVANKPGAIVICGIGGAYPSSGIAIGEAVCAETEIYGDLGAESPGGFLDMQALGFPVATTASGALFNELPMHVFPAGRRARFVTVSTCTGTKSGALTMELRTRGAVENMEGAAIAHVAHLHGIPVGEIRGISNVASDRDKSTWKITQAAEAAQQALLQWLSRK